jgi:hypothetical protein
MDRWIRAEKVRLIRAVAGGSDRYMPRHRHLRIPSPRVSTITATGTIDAPAKGHCGVAFLA